jgi:HEPN domain-containing protein
MSMTLKQHVDHWVDSSNSNFDSMECLFKNKHYLEAMYMGHLSVEKLFKAMLACFDKPIKYTHSLTQLAELCNIVLTDEIAAELKGINRFNVDAKYASRKSVVYKQCTPQFIEKWSEIISKWHSLLKEQVLELRESLPDRIPATHPVDTF